MLKPTTKFYSSKFKTSSRNWWWSQEGDMLFLLFGHVSWSFQTVGSLGWVFWQNWSPKWPIGKMRNNFSPHMGSANRRRNSSNNNSLHRWECKFKFPYLSIRKDLNQCIVMKKRECHSNFSLRKSSLFLRCSSHNILPKDSHRNGKIAKKEEWKGAKLWSSLSISI